MDNGLSRYQKMLQAKYIGSIFSDLKIFISEQFEKLADSLSFSLENKTLSVRVENSDTNLIKEVAENTRKSAARMKEISEKKQEPQTIAGTVSVNVQNWPVEKEKVEKVEVTNWQKQQDVVFPSELRVSNLSDIKIPSVNVEKTDLSSLETALNGLKSAFSSLSSSILSQKAPKIVIPPQKDIKFPKELSIKEAKEIVAATTDGLQGVRDDLGEIYKAFTEIDFPKQVGGSGTTVLSSGQTVSDVGIKALCGLPKSTAVTVTTSATKLPSTNLQYRKSMIVYNISANTIYIGGSDVTTSNGLPVLSESYSPPIDAGETMTIYAIAGSSSEVRVLEVSSEREGA